MPLSVSGVRTAVARLAFALVASLVVLLVVGAPAALAHAQLVGTIPQAGSTVTAQPPLVVFEFNQSVGFTLGAVRVYDASGREVDDGRVAHPGGLGSRVGVGLGRGLPDGTYTATYRVISADTHVVFGGLVFVIGHASASSPTVASLIDRGRAGELTAIAFGVVRGLDYVSFALLIGGFAFLGLVWRGGWRSGGGAPGSSGLEAVARGAGGRMRGLLLGAAVLGLASSVLGVLLEGASASGLSLWASARWSVIGSVLGTRFGWVWGSRAVLWAVLGLVLLAPGTRAVGLLGGSAAGSRRLRRALGGPAALACGYLAITPALSGHGSVQSPVWVLFPVDAIHVVAVSVWVGGIACLVGVLPGATRRLDPPERSRLIADVVGRFSVVALACVVGIALSGAVQALILVGSLDALFSSAYGRVVLAKVALFAVLLGFGAVNRRRIIPALGRLVEAGRSPGAIGLLLRRSLTGEAFVMLAVLGLTAALIATTPPVDAAGSPFSTTTLIGPAELELTVDPARVGLNAIHVYLFDARTGAQFTQTVELDVAASLPAKAIGPLALHANAAGPGHYVLDAAELTPGGTWRLQITDRVSAFDEYTKTIEVPIR